jgi:hypothetical protein
MGIQKDKLHPTKIELGSSFTSLGYGYTRVVTQANVITSEAMKASTSLDRVQGPLWPSTSDPNPTSCESG